VVKPSVQSKPGGRAKSRAKATAAGKPARKADSANTGNVSDKSPRKAVAHSSPSPEDRELPAAAVRVQTLTVVEDEEDMRLDRWFRHRFPGLAMSHLNRIVRKGEVRVNGKRAETSTRLAIGDSVRVPPLRLDDPALPAVRRAVDTQADIEFLKSITLYEDAHILVLNKPFGLAVQGGPGIKRHVDGLLECMTPRNGQKPRLVHRIDRDTSGVLLVARTRKMAADLGEIFRKRETKKIYWAIVRGVPRPAQGRISLFLKKGPGMTGERSHKSSQRMASRVPERGFHGDPEKMQIAKHGDDAAQHSVTYYTIVDKVAPRLAWLSMKPITGRTHQLRAHAEAIGHPIIGDPKYSLPMADNDPRRSDPLRALPSGIENKLHLLARRLVLPNPRGGILDVTAPLPPHMQKTFDLFGFDAGQYDPIEDAPE
jgi:23S rRNA pseudouridine955/2504/2580 synthase